METSQSSQRMHPLVAGAAASVMLVSLLGAAAITGILPTSHGSVPQEQPQPVASATAPAAMQAPAPAIADAAPAPRAAEPVVHHHVVHHTTTVRSQPAVYAQAAAPQAAPVYTQPAPAPVHTAQNSPVGIGVGAVVGGLIGSQVGGGNGRTLATIAGAIGGGYMGNEIAKRNP
jgi:uncharacterized protein YcfJ